MLRQVSTSETEIILQNLGDCLAVAGDVVELGCYEGDSSLLFAERLKKTGSEKKWWIYDSFEGLPEKSAEDFSEAGRDFREGELKVTKKYVKQRFLRANLALPIIKKAWFSELDPEGDLPKEICFAFLDGDLYQSIKTSLGLVAGKVSAGGKIIVHDYNNPQLPGAAKAVEEFLALDNKAWKFSQRETLAILTRIR